MICLVCVTDKGRHTAPGGHYSEAGDIPGRGSGQANSHHHQSDRADTLQHHWPKLCPATGRQACRGRVQNAGNYYT